MLKDYIPFNEQEKHDLPIILEALQDNNSLTRDNKIGHFTVSCWILNQNHDHVLMCYHRIYNSYAWLGGHVDGMSDFKQVALKEAYEESGLSNIRLLFDKPISIEILTVDGHIKNNEYVSSHLHYNVTYLMEANDQDELVIKEDENSDLAWFSLDDALKASSEPWLIENIYKKLNKKIRVLLV